MSFKGKTNVYACAECRGATVTIDVDEGVTPFSIPCLANGEAGVCQGIARSCMYRPAMFPRDVELTPRFEWYKPKVEHVELSCRDHVAAGGLLLRKVGAERCLTVECGADATHRVFWPGKPPGGMCTPCEARAKTVSNVMGFHLHTEVM